MVFRTSCFVMICGCFLALTLVGVRLAGGEPNRQAAASDEKSPEPVASIPGFTFVKKNKQGYSEYRHDKTGIVFVKLSGGTFKMGGTKKEERDFLSSIPENERPAVKKYLAPEKPRHEVKLGAFLIAKYEVTQARWKAVMGTSPSDFKGDELPVEQVSWVDCQEFCKKTGLSLPTEAQWEYACRAGTRTSFGFGDAEKDLGDHAWFYRNSGHKVLPAGTKWDGRKVRGWGCRTHPVGAKKPNGFGLHDMHGNVWEWCQDVFDLEYYSSVESSNGDEACKEGSGGRVIRGGGWDGRPRGCRSAYRGSGPPDGHRGILGFRPARPLR